MFFGIGLSYKPFLRRCSLLWWIWAPCWSWKEHKAWSGRSIVCRKKMEEREKEEMKKKQSFQSSSWLSWKHHLFKVRLTTSLLEPLEPQRTSVNKGKKATYPPTCYGSLLLPSTHRLPPSVPDTFFKLSFNLSLSTDYNHCCDSAK